MTNGDLFSNCSQHYPIESYFINCTNTTRPCELIHDFAVVSQLLTILDFYTSSVLFLIAGVINVYFLWICLPLYLKMNQETKKRYVFVISRCISSISAAITLLILRCILYVYFPPESSSYYLYAIVIIADDISFYGLQGAYIGMALLLYIGVIHPVYFSTRLTLRKIYVLAISNYFVAALISFPCGAFQTATYVPGPIQCGSQRCSPIVGLINFIVVSIYFFLTILILSFVFICLSFHIYQAKKLGSYTSSQTLHHARIRLGWTLTAIILISLAEGIPSAFLIGLQADSVLNTCNNFYQADRLVQVTVFTSIDSIVWAFVLIIDPLASILLDERIIARVKRHVNRSKLYYAKFLDSYVESIQSILYWTGIMVPFILFTIAFFLNGYFIFILIPEFKRMNDTTKKQYIFVLSRGISSLSASFIMMLMRGLQLFSPTFTILLLFYFVDDLSFYTLLGSYVGSAVLLYLATTRPIFYSLRISVQIIFRFAIANLIGSIILAITTAVFQAAEETNGPFDCDPNVCQHIINIAMFSIISISFVIPIMTLSFVLLMLYCHKSRAESIGSFSSDSSTFSSARTRLAWTLFTFSLISLSEAIPASFMVGLTIDGDITICTNFYQADHLIFPAIMTSFQTLAWGIALIVDPLCGLLFDPKIRKVVVRHYIEEVENIVYWVGFIIPFTLFFMAAVLNGYFLYAVLPEFRKMNDKTKKQYIFVISRGISSFSAAIVMLLLRGIQIISPGFTIYLLFFAIDDLSFYSLLGSYVGSATLLYLATVRPVFYSLRISVRTVYRFAVANLIGSIVLSGITSVFQAAEQSEGPFNCDPDYCQHILNIVMFSIISIASTIPIVVLSFVLVTLCFHKSMSESNGSFSMDSSIFTAARTRLAWTLFTFTLISLSEAMPAFYLVRLNIDSDMTQCVSFYQADHLIYPAIMSSLQTLVWSIALVVDPLCGLLFDPRIRKVLVRHIFNLKSFLTNTFCCVFLSGQNDCSEEIKYEV